jgi:hypothetical protein
MKVKEKKFKRLFFDIETSPNIVFSWNIGYNLNISYENILTERAVICICYKYEHDKNVKYLTWDKGNDVEMLKEFSKILNEADEVIGHNCDKYDIKWFRTRCLKFGISVTPYITSIDTLKEAKKYFRFNSNRLDYIGQYLGVGKKMETGGFQLWKDIVMKNSKLAMTTMVQYCKQDVMLLEEVYHKFNPYIKHKTYIGKLTDVESKGICPECDSDKIHKHKLRVSAAGRYTQQYKCASCGKYHSVSVRKEDVQL